MALKPQTCAVASFLAGTQLATLAALAGEPDVSNVVQLLESFYEAKRQGFRQVLEELLSEAGDEAIGSVRRW